MAHKVFDNLLAFWEFIRLAREAHEDLAIILLDFEKAYDHVDWNFLEGVLLRMGFQEAWVRGVAAWYNKACSKVLIAGGMGP